MTTSPSIPSLEPTLEHRALNRSGPTAPPAPMARLEAIDILRGLVMIVMMLDHTRDFVHAPAIHGIDPTDLTQTTGAIFFTRWITHFCAPLFVFLAGTSIYLQKLRGKPIGQLSSFLLKRGFWLIFLELTLVKFAMWFNVIPTYLATLQVIWAIGVSMIVMAALVRLPTWIVGAIGVAIIALHDLTDGIHVTPWTGPNDPVPSAAAKLWILIHQGGAMPVAGWPSPVVMVIYSLIPWIGVMAAGYAFGRLYELDTDRRRKLLVQSGAACLLAFFTLRIMNGYGDPVPWTAQSRTAMTIVSFFNVNKYPASLSFLLMTLGAGMLGLAAFEGWRAESRAKRVLLDFGRVPLFYYLLQWVTAHGLAVVLGLLAGKSVAYLFMNPPDVFINAPKDAGFSLAVVWMAWAGGVILLYPLCRWYAGVKARRKDWWISYT